ncbi:MAG: sulfatase-like hydrolase/transferase [Oligoflexales bacterium]
MKVSRAALRDAATFTVFSLYLLAAVIGFHSLTEWLFLTTKPSFFQSLSFGKWLEILVLSPALVFFVLIPLQLGFAALGVAVPRRKIGTKVAVILPAFFLMVSIGLLTDNFTYTLFRWGIVTLAPTYGKILYGIVAALVFALLNSYLAGVLERRIDAGQTKKDKFIVSGAAGFYVAIFGVYFAGGIGNTASNRATQSNRLPNIIMFASDGVDANNLPMYGYARNTTPFMNSIADQFLIMDNPISNSAKTVSSVFSTLSGRTPLASGLVSSPQVLTEDSAKKHLPKILKNLGYKTVQSSINNHVDAFYINMKEGFDRVNGKVDFLNYPVIKDGKSYWSIFFIREMYFRIQERTFHLLGLNKMKAFDDFLMGTRKDRDFSDSQRVDDVLDFMAAKGQPVFAHIHLINSHCCEFHPQTRVFSANSDKMYDLYDDTILEADALFKKLVDALRARGILDNTILVYSSDHSHSHKVDERVPFMIRFPRAEHRGHIRETTQLLDLPPTLLSYLKQPIPDWMEGSNLLDPKGIPNDRWILSASDIRDQLDTSPGKPYNPLSGVSLTICDHHYSWNPEEKILKSKRIPRHTYPCTPMASNDEIRDYLEEKADNFVTTFVNQLQTPMEGVL